MTVEGVIGTTAGDHGHSIALIGYGIVSTITGVASVIIIWRFSGDRRRLRRGRGTRSADRRGHVLPRSPRTSSSPRFTTSSPAARRRRAGSASACAMASVTLMPLSGRAKKPIGAPAVRRDTGEGTQTFCAPYLSLAIRSGSPPCRSPTLAGGVRCARATSSPLSTATGSDVASARTRSGRGRPSDRTVVRSSA